MAEVTFAEVELAYQESRKGKESVPKIIVVNDEGESQPALTLPDIPPDWAMPLDVHNATMQKTAVYRCVDPTCGGEHEEYRTNARDLPFAKVCGCIKEKIADAEAGSELEKCTAVALRRVTYPGEGVPLNARRFEALVIYQNAADPSKFSIPGRNSEPTDAGYKRIEITNIHAYNRWAKHINTVETNKMKDHREMHREYWQARRRAMRDNVDARIRHDATLKSISRLVRKRSDQKFITRYGKPLDAHFHSQLIEFDQGKVQGWCAEDTGWRERRAK